jgi:hypothetical protein
MAKGSTDYWLTQSNFLPALIAQIKDAVIEGSALINRLDAIDGGLDGVINLDQLNSEECSLLGQLLGISESVSVNYYITGVIIPDATGSYVKTGISQGYPYYQKKYSDWFICYIGGFWNICNSLTQPSNGYWSKSAGNGVEGDYEPSLLSEGVATVSKGIFDATYLLNKLDILDGTMDGKLSLSDLNSEQCDMLAKLAGIDTSLLTGSDLINSLDSIDGTIDGKIDILNTDLKAKLDVLDGTMDGKLSLADLNSESCDMLAKLTGIDVSLLAGSDLLNKLDALDGTMDGKLDLTQLNSSDVKTNLDTVITKLTSSVDNLTSIITKLTTSNTWLESIYNKGVEIWSTTLNTSCVVVAAVWDTRTAIKFISPTTNNSHIYVYLGGVCGGTAICDLTHGETFISHDPGIFSAKAGDADEILAMEQW